MNNNKVTISVNNRTGKKLQTCIYGFADDLDLPKILKYFKLKNKIYPGAIVVFHDSEKAVERMEYAFPKLLEYAFKQGYSFKRIEE